jgi:hypothetical protein
MLTPSGTRGAKGAVLSSGQRQFLFGESGGVAAVSNLVINGALTWLSFRHVTRVPLWRQQGVAGSVIMTSFFLPLLTCLIVSPLAHARLRNGTLQPFEFCAGWKLIPEGVVLRGLLVGVVCAVVLSPAILVTLNEIGVTNMSLGHFVALMAIFSGVEGGLVTPLLAACAIRGPMTS